MNPFLEGGLIGLGLLAIAAVFAGISVVLSRLRAKRGVDEQRVAQIEREKAARDECLCIVGCSVNGRCPLHGDAAMRQRLTESKDLDDPRRTVEERSIARPVVRATLACGYCAHGFTQEFTEEDDLRHNTWMGGLPNRIANVKRERRYTVRCWLFWSTLKVEEVREPIACPNCGRKSCAIAKREPIAPPPTDDVGRTIHRTPTGFPYKSVNPRTYSSSTRGI